MLLLTAKWWLDRGMTRQPLLLRALALLFLLQLLSLLCAAAY
jgi:hypothetical protein